jgi:DNA-binding response OmpR family regulator
MGVDEPPLRSGDRSIDVYVHKVRVKLEDALPQRRFIHTHVGFGYRFAAEPSHAFHIS